MNRDKLNVKVMEPNSKKVDEEQRRNTRLCASVGLLAILIAACAFLFKYVLRAINIFSTTSVVFNYLVVLFCCTLAITITIFVHLIYYLVCDLMRYNISDKKYLNYDALSDKAYNALWLEIKNLGIIFLIIFSMSIFVVVLCSTGIDKAINILVFLSCLLVGVFLAFEGIHYLKKIGISKHLKSFGISLAKCLIVAILCYVFAVTIITTSNVTLTSKFNSNGVVEILKKYNIEGGNLNIKIYDVSNDKEIYNKDVIVEDVLYAYEGIGVHIKENGKILSEGGLLDAEFGYWRYSIDISDIVTDAGKYNMVMQLAESKETIHLDNMFKVENGKYIFALEEMVKKY